MISLSFGQMNATSEARSPWGSPGVGMRTRWKLDFSTPSEYACSESPILTVMQPGMWGQSCHASTCSAMPVRKISHAHMHAFYCFQLAVSTYLKHADRLVHSIAILACRQLQACGA